MVTVPCNLLGAASHKTQKIHAIDKFIAFKQYIYQIPYRLCDAFEDANDAVILMK